MNTTKYVMVVVFLTILVSSLSEGALPAGHGARFAREITTVFGKTAYIRACFLGRSRCFTSLTIKPQNLWIFHSHRIIANIKICSLETG